MVLNPTVDVRARRPCAGGVRGPTEPPPNRLTFPPATLPSTVNAGLVAALAAALLYGCYLAGYKRFFGDYPALSYLFVVNAAAVGWYLPVAAPFLSRLTRLAPGALAALFGIALLTGLAIAALFEALRRGDVSYVTPLNKLVPLFVLPLELLFFEAGLSALQMGGVVLATAGIYASNYESGGLVDPFRRALSYRPAQLALASAAMFGVVDAGKRLLLQDLALPAPLVVWVSLVGITGVVAPLGYRQRGRLPRRPPTRRRRRGHRARQPPHRPRVRRTARQRRLLHRQRAGRRRRPPRGTRPRRGLVRPAARRGRAHRRRRRVRRARVSRPGRGPPGHRPYDPTEPSRMRSATIAM